MKKCPTPPRLITLLAVVVAGELSAGAELRPARDYERLRDGYDLMKGTYEGTARIALDKRFVRRGETYRITLTFENTSDHAYDVFNPSLSNSTVTTGVLAIYDDKQRFIGNLLVPPWGGGATTVEVNFTTWCRIAAGEKRSLSLERVAGVVGGTQFIEPIRHGLPPGKYYIQAVYLDRFASSCPWYQPANPCGEANGLRSDEGEIQLPPEPVRELQEHGRDKIDHALKGWLKKYDGSELFRSNIVELLILPPPGGPDSDRAARLDDVRGVSGRI